MISFLAFSLKVLALYFIFQTVITYYNFDLPVYNQNWRIYLFVYLPFAMGWEAIINTVFQRKEDKKQD